MDVAIIGIQGVGMAHAMAAERCGHRVIAVLDPNPLAKSRLGDEWVNEWGAFRQTMAPRHKPAYFSSPEEFAGVSADLLVIACPTRWHLQYARRYCENYRILLCEKPLAYSSEAVAALPTSAKHKLLVGHNYLLHPETPEHINPVCVIRYSHSYPPKETHKRECGVWWDMGTHCLAQMLHYIPKEQWDQIRCMCKTVSPDDASATFVAGTQVFLLQAAYSHWQPGFWVDSTQLNGFDVFGAQIEAVERGTHPATYEMGYTITRLANEVAPYFE